MKCYKCNGTGYYDIDNECPVCDGTGEYNVNEGSADLIKVMKTGKKLQTKCGMKYVYVLWCSESESLLTLYSSKRKAMIGLNEELFVLENYAKKRGEYFVKQNSDKTAFTIVIDTGEEFSVSVNRVNVL